MKVSKEKINQSRDILKGFGKIENQIAYQNPPAVFMFQPDSYEIVTGSNLKIWERLMAEKVGLKPTLNASMTGTVSCCPDCDDCDMD